MNPVQRHGSKVLMVTAGSRTRVGLQSFLFWSRDCSAVYELSVAVKHPVTDCDTDLRGRMAMRMAFSWTCQPNMKEPRAQSSRQRRKPRAPPGRHQMDAAAGFGEGQKRKPPVNELVQVKPLNWYVLLNNTLNNSSGRLPAYRKNQKATNIFAAAVTTVNDTLSVFLHYNLLRYIQFNDISNLMTVSI